MKDQIAKIIEIGKKDYCTKDDFEYILPNYPIISGKEFIFSSGCSPTYLTLGDDIEQYVKGLHLVELKYRSKTNNKRGFGSLSRSYCVVLTLYKTNPKLSDELGKWIAFNGGNFNIYDCSDGRECVPNWQLTKEAMEELYNILVKEGRITPP